jgi:hypothetical protein
MMTIEIIPENRWAAVKAVELANKNDPDAYDISNVHEGYAALCALFQHILDHEQPPVDPALELARRLAENHWGGEDAPPQRNNGIYPNHPQLDAGARL